jgi:hypothetical protein
MMLGKNPGTDETWKKIPEGSIGAELGVWKGESSAKFLKRAKHLHLVDIWSADIYYNDGDFSQRFKERYGPIIGEITYDSVKKYHDKIYQSVVDKFKGKPVTIHRMTTAEWFETFTETLDWIYVDAGHDYDQCFRDLENSIKVVKVGGYIFGDDYGSNKPAAKNQVTQAVNDFVNKHNLSVDNFYMDQFKIKL